MTPPREAPRAAVIVSGCTLAITAGACAWAWWGAGPSPERALQAAVGAAGLVLLGGLIALLGVRWAPRSWTGGRLGAREPMSKRQRMTYVTAAICTAGYVAVVAAGFLAPDAVGAIAGAYATLAAALGVTAAGYTYSEGRRPSGGGGEWAAPKTEDEP